MRSLSITVFNAGTSKKRAEALENENCAVQFESLVPRNGETVTATKVAVKGCESTYNMVYMC